MSNHQPDQKAERTGEKTAILVDGGFYRRRAHYLFGEKTPEARANELVEYCKRHLASGGYRNDLYRIFYYDCPPMAGNLYHPLRQKPVCMKDTDVFSWANDFFEELSNKRKLALRMGTLQEQESAFRIKRSAMNRLCRGEIAVSDLKDSDFEPDFVQKGVDMRIGIDIATLSSKHQVQQIVLISGDSDFVPAAKHARREGIDFILDPMWQGIKKELNEHIDGLQTRTGKSPDPEKESLHVDYGKTHRGRKQKPKRK